MSSQQIAYAQGPPSYTVPSGVEYYNGGGYTQQYSGGYGTNYAIPSQPLVQTEMIPVQMQQMQTVMVQEPVVEMVPVQQVQQLIEMVPVQVYSPTPTPTKSPPLKERRAEPERAVPEYERAAPTPEPELEPEIIERYTIREKVKSVCYSCRCVDVSTRNIFICFAEKVPNIIQVPVEKIRYEEVKIPVDKVASTYLVVFAIHVTYTIPADQDSCERSSSRHSC